MITLSLSPVLLYVLTTIPFAILCALAAPSRNRSPKAWFFGGMILGAFGLIAILIMGKAEPEPAKP